MDYARSLRILRAARNLTQHAVAQMVGSDDTAVSRWESGDRTPSLDRAQALAKALGCPLDVFLQLAGDAETPCTPEDSQRVVALLRGNGQAVTP